MLSLGLLFFLKIISHVMSLFGSKYNFKTTLSGSVKKNDIGSFIRTTLSLWITLCSVDFIAILILSVHEHRILFYFVSYVVFHQCLIVL